MKTAWPPPDVVLLSFVESWPGSLGLEIRRSRGTVERIGHYSSTYNIIGAK